MRNTRFFVLLVFFGCSGNSAPPKCVPGRVQTCPCSGSTGQQTCGSDGFYGACECPSILPDGGPRSDSGPVDAGLDLGAEDTGVDQGLDLGDADQGVDAGASDAGWMPSPLDLGTGDQGPYTVHTSIAPYYDPGLSQCASLFPPDQVIENMGVMVPMPAGFEFFGQPHSQGFLSSNGTIQFGGMTVSDQPVPLPDPAYPNLIALNWGDFRLQDQVGGSICQLSRDTTEIFTWDRATLPTQGPILNNFSAWINSVGTINVLLLWDGNANGTIGIQGPNANDALSVLPCGSNCSNLNMDQGAVISFVPTGWSGGWDLEPQLIASIPPIYPGQEISLSNIRIVNRGDIASDPLGFRLFSTLDVGEEAGGLPQFATGGVGSVAPGAAAPLELVFIESSVLDLQPGLYPATFWLETYDFGDVGAKDAVLANNVMTLDIEVLPFVGPITFTTTTLPDATAGQAYTAQLQATGSPNLQFTEARPQSGFLDVSATGEITGTLPTPGSYPITVRVIGEPQYEPAEMTFNVIVP